MATIDSVDYFRWNDDGTYGEALTWPEVMAAMRLERRRLLEDLLGPLAGAPWATSSLVNPVTGAITLTGPALRCVGSALTPSVAGAVITLAAGTVLFAPTYVPPTVPATPTLANQYPAIPRNNVYLCSVPAHPDDRVVPGTAAGTVPASSALTLTGSSNALNADPRIDIVVVRVLNQQTIAADARQPPTVARLQGSTTTTSRQPRRRYRTQLEYLLVEGTPDPSPVAPATPAGYVRIASVQMPGGSAAYDSATLVDERTFLEWRIGDIHYQSIRTLSISAAAAEVASPAVFSGTLSSIDLVTATTYAAVFPVTTDVGNRVRAVRVYAFKATNNTNTITIRLRGRNAAGVITSIASASNNGNSPGAVTLTISGLTTTITSGNQYFIEIEGSGTATDFVYWAEVDYDRP